MNIDAAMASFFEELEKISYEMPAAPSFGKNVGKSYGWGSSKGEFSTQFRSAGMRSPKPAKPQSLPGTPKIKGRVLSPKTTAEANNMVELRRGLSNIETRQ